MLATISNIYFYCGACGCSEEDISVPNWCMAHDDVIKWKHFPRYWSFVRGIHRSPVNSPHTGQWRGALICAWINGWVNNGQAGDLRRHRAHYDVIVMYVQPLYGERHTGAATGYRSGFRLRQFCNGAVSVFMSVWQQHSNFLAKYYSSRKMIHAKVCGIFICNQAP